MKPCSKYRKPIGLLAIRGLDAGEEKRVHAHLKICGQCRGYYEEMSNLSRRLETVELRSEIEASESFQKSLLRRLQADSERPVWSWLTAWNSISLFNWRVALPTVAASLLLVAVLPILLRRPKVVPPTTSGVPVQSLGAGPEDLPTIGAYQLIANRSPEDLDEFMVKQCNRNPPQMPTSARGLMD